MNHFEGITVDDHPNGAENAGILCGDPRQVCRRAARQSLSRRKPADLIQRRVTASHF